MQKGYHNTTNWALLAALTLIWGSSYILIKKGLLVFSPIELACLRLSVSFIALTPFMFKAIKTIPKEKYPLTFAIGLFGSGLPGFLFAFSMTRINSSVNGIINSLSPLFTLLIAALLFKTLLPKVKIAGVIIGLAGALILILFKPNGNFNGDFAFAILPVLATFCYGLSTNIVKNKFPNESSVNITSLAMCMIGLPCLIGLSFTGFYTKMATVPGAWQALMYIIVLAVMGTVVAWMLFYKLIQRTDALFGASVTYLIPIVAIAWGIFDGEAFSIVQLGGMALILSGVYFTSLTAWPWQNTKTA